MTVCPRTQNPFVEIGNANRLFLADLWFAAAVSLHESLSIRLSYLLNYRLALSASVFRR